MIREGTQKEEKQESKQAVEKSPENIDFQDKRILTARSPWNEDSLTAVQALFQEEIATQDNRGPVAQLVEQRFALPEVVSSTLAGPILRVLKKLRRKCCLCNYICIWLSP